MKKRFNIQKTYVTSKTAEQSFAELDAVVSNSFYDSKYSTWGSLDAVDPPEFLLMLKWTGWNTRMSGDLFSTKLHVKLTKLEERTQIDVKTETNLAFFILLPLLLLGIGSSPVQNKQVDFLDAFIMALVVALIILVLTGWRKKC